MPGDEVSISFNLSLPLEQALELLLTLRKNGKNAISVKTTKTARMPKRQIAESDEREKGYFKRIPVATLRRVISAIAAQYGDNVFRPGDAFAVASKLGLSRTLSRYAVEYAVQQGEIHKVASGRYSSKAQTKYEPVADSLIDIVTQHADRLLSTFKLMSKVSEIVSLYFGQEGLAARFMNENKSGMLDVRISKDVFSTYHVKQHVRLIVSCRHLVEILSIKAGSEFHVILKEKGAVYSAGYLGKEHLLNAKDFSTQESPYDIETPIDPNSGAISYSEIALPRSMLHDILKDVRVHSDVVRVLCKNGRVVLDSSFESQGFGRELVDNGQDVKISNIEGEETNACFEMDDILPMVRKRITGSDSLALKVNKAAMIIQLMDEQGFKVQWFIAPCKVEEAAASPPQTQAALHNVEKRMDELERQMGIKDSK